MGASNELPESEELDALYDRFLLRRQVAQVSQAGLLEMLGNGGGRKQVGLADQVLAVGAAWVCWRWGRRLDVWLGSNAEGTRRAAGGSCVPQCATIAPC